MADKQTVETLLVQQPGMNATGILIPFDVEKVLGAKRVPVKALVNGVEYRGSVVRMGGEYCLGIPKAFRDAAGIKSGDNIVVTLELDSEPRIVTPPEDLVIALSVLRGGMHAWNSLSYTERKEQVRAIENAKHLETRMRRINRAVELISSKIN